MHFAFAPFGKYSERLSGLDASQMNTLVLEMVFRMQALDKLYTYHRK